MNKLLLILAVFFGVQVAQAGILIEPYLGYETGSFKYAEVGTPDSSFTDTITGTGMGLRLGYKFLIPWVALDYTTVSGKGKAGDPTEENYDITQTGMAAVVGADIPLLRAWLGYGFSNESVRKATANSVETKLKGTYTKVGVGFKFIPFVSLNAEYKINNDDKVEGSGFSSNKSDVFSSLSNNSLMISVSAPFNL
jgi:hypothetical protein